MPIDKYIRETITGKLERRKEGRKFKKELKTETDAEEKRVFREERTRIAMERAREKGVSKAKGIDIGRIVKKASAKLEKMEQQGKKSAIDDFIGLKPANNRRGDQRSNKKWDTILGESPKKKKKDFIDYI